MKLFIILSALIASCIGAFGAAVTLESLDPDTLATNGVPPHIVYVFLNPHQFKFNDPTNGITITNVTGVYGTSTNIWTIDGFGDIHPAVTNAQVTVTNLVVDGQFEARGTAVLSKKSQLLVLGTNVLGSDVSSMFYCISPTNDASQVILSLKDGSAPGELLLIVNYTNAVPANGAFTLPANSLVSGGGHVIQPEDWVATNTFSALYTWQSPDWIMIDAFAANGQSVFQTNYFQNIVVYSNITLRGNSTLTINNITLTTNDLWHTNLVGGIATLQPVNLGLQPMIVKGLTVGTNTTSSALLPAPLANNVLSSIGNTDAGDPVERYIYIAQATSNGNPRSWLKSVVLTNSNSFQLGGNDGTSQVTFDILELGGNDFQFLVQTNSATIVNIHPTATDGNVAYTLDTDRTHTTGKIFEVDNNTTNRLVVTPTSVLIGTDIFSTNFSNPYALQVSNFTDNNAALLVETLGGNGTTDEYPIYFYSHLTNSPLHQTMVINEETSATASIGTHTLLLVEEQTRASNSVTQWPTYVEAGLNAGKFTVNPVGGTNGATLALWGAVQPARNALNIGVGSYVPTSTDNNASTNVGVSGTVDGITGSQKAVGGFFEIGTTTPLPKIPSSAGILIDGHDSGAPLILGQTNGAVQFRVAANSGYTGTGTNVFVDNGTFTNNITLGTITANLLSIGTLQLSALTSNTFAYIGSATNITNAPYVPVNKAGDTMTGPLIPATYTVGTLPAAAANTGARVWCSDVLTPWGTAEEVYSDGSVWKLTATKIQATTSLQQYFLNALAARLNIHTPITGAYFASDNIAALGVLPRQISVNGAAAAASGTGSSTYGTYTSLTTGSTTNGNALVRGPLISAMVNADVLACGGAYSFSTACTSAELYWAAVGMDSGNSSAYPVSGCYFLYDMFNVNGHGLTGAATNHWICVTGKASVYTYVDSGLTVNTSNTSSFDRLMIQATTNNVYFYTNGVLSQTLSTGTSIPTAAMYMSKCFIVKTNGTTARALSEAEPFMHYRLTASRTLP